MPKVFTSKNQRIGELGEKIAEKYLINKGFEIIDQNYTKQFGEIDIIAKINGILHFIEVKSISRLANKDTYVKPEENMHHKKIERFVKTTQFYLMEKHVSHETQWQIDLVCVYLDSENKKAQVRLLEHII